MYRVSIIGLGTWGEKYISTIKEMDDVEIISACRRTNDRPLFLPGHCKFYTNIDFMKDAGGFDYLIITTDPISQPRIAEQISPTIKLMLEKPLALLATDAEALFDLRSNLGGSIFVNHIHLYSEAFQLLKDRTRNEHIESIHSSGFGIGPCREEYSALYDYAPHDLSMVLDLLVDTQYDLISATKHESKNGEHYDAVLNFGDTLVSIEVGNDACKSRVLSIETANNIYCYDGIKQSLSMNGAEIFVASEKPLKRALRAFFRGEQADKKTNLAILSVLHDIDEMTRQVQDE